MSSNIPKKGDIIINPNTQRPVKVGSRTWLKLVKQGIVEGRYTDPNELGNLPEQYEEIPPEEIEQKIEEVNKTLPRGQQAVRGRGRYKGKIVSRNKRLAPEEVSKYTTQVATRAVRNNIEAIQDYDDDDIEGMLEKMILAEMMGSSPGGHSNPQPREEEPNVPRARGQSRTARATRATNPYTLYRPKKAQPKQDEYETVAPDEYDYEEVEQHSDGDDYDTSENWEY